MIDQNAPLDKFVHGESDTVAVEPLAVYRTRAAQYAARLDYEMRRSG